MPRNDGRRGPYITMDERMAKPKWSRDTGCGNLALELRKARGELGLTQAEMADAIGVTRSRLAQWETAKRAMLQRDFEGVSAFFRDRLPSWSEVEKRVSPTDRGCRIRSLVWGE